MDDNGLIPGDGRKASPARHEDRPIIDRPWPTWRLVIVLAWPAWVQQLLNFFVSLSDRFLAGRAQAETAAGQVAIQAAQTTVFYISWFISCYTVLVSVGSTALVARFIGAGDRRNAIHATNQSILLAVGLGLLGSIVALTTLPWLLTGLQLETHAAEFAADYLRPLFLLLTFQVIEAAGVACLAGAGDTRSGLFVLGGVALINVPLAWGFFHGFGLFEPLGFTGIAIGTALAHTGGGLAVLLLLVRGRAGLHLRLKRLQPNFELIRRLLRVSLPAAADSLSIAAGQFWFLGIVNQLGNVPAAAHGIALVWEALGFLSGAAFGTAAMTLVGQSLGAHRPAQAARCGWTAFYLATGVMAFMGVQFVAHAPSMFRLFCPQPEQAPIVAAGVPVLRVIAIAMPFLASCIVFTSALRGAGDTRVPVLFTWLGFFTVRIPLAYLLTRDSVRVGSLFTLPGASLGLMGAWLAMIADISVRGIFFAIRFASGRWKKMHV